MQCYVLSLKQGFTWYKAHRISYKVNLLVCNEYFFHLGFISFIIIFFRNDNLQIYERLIHSSTMYTNRRIIASASLSKSQDLSIRKFENIEGAAANAEEEEDNNNQNQNAAINIWNIYTSITFG